MTHSLHGDDLIVFTLSHAYYRVVFDLGSGRGGIVLNRLLIPAAIRRLLLVFLLDSWGLSLVAVLIGLDLLLSILQIPFLLVLIELGIDLTQNGVDALAHYLQQLLFEIGLLAPIVHILNPLGDVIQQNSDYNYPVMVILALPHSSGGGQILGQKFLGHFCPRKHF